MLVLVRPIFNQMSGYEGGSGVAPTITIRDIDGIQVRRINTLSMVVVIVVIPIAVEGVG